MSNPNPHHPEDRNLELAADVLLTRARPLPAHHAMVIEDLRPDENAEFLAALEW